MIGCRKHLFVLIIISAILGVFPLSCPAAAALSFEGGESSRPAPPAPTLVGPGEDIITSKVKPIITGLTASGTAVYIYIDGIFNGQTEILTHKSGTANFSYTPFLNLSVGPHEIWAVAKNRSGVKSKISDILKFNIEKPFPAPTIFKPIVNKKTVYSKPYITGVAKNNSVVKVFVDKKLSGEFKVDNHNSGTANFSYLTPYPLTEGGHIVYTIAIDERGKESQWSNIEYFTVIKPRQPKISETAASDALVNKEIAGNTEETKVIDHSKTKVINNGDANSVTANNEIVDKYNANNENINNEIIDNDIINYEAAEDECDEYIENEFVDNNKVDNEIAAEYESDVSVHAPTSTGGIGELTRLERLDREKMVDYSQTGRINESAENQGKLKLNLIIFLLFLLAVVGWIFWVNRELIREKRLEQVKENDDDTSP